MTAQSPACPFCSSRHVDLEHLECWNCGRSLDAQLLASAAALEARGYDLEQLDRDNPYNGFLLF